MRIIVIGAGLIGVSTAYFLAKSGNEVIVVDRRNGVGLETSFANGGMLTPSQAAPWNTPGIGLKMMKWLGRGHSPLIVKPSALLSLPGWGYSFLRNSRSDIYGKNQKKNFILASYSLEIMAGLRKQYGFDYNQSGTGTMKIYRNPMDFNHACGFLNNFNRNKSMYQLLDAGQVISLEPALSASGNSIAGGIYFPGDESGDAYKFCHELGRIASTLGVKFQLETKVKSLVRSGKRIKAITTTAGELEADAFVLAAGSYSTLLAKTVDVYLPIQPVKGYSLTLSYHGAKTGLTLPIIDESRHIAVTPLGDRIRIAGVAELAGYSDNIDDARISMMLGYFKETYPDIIGNDVNLAMEKWTGLRPYTCDGVPVMGSSPIDNLYMNTGHGHLGWTMAAGSGRLVADLINRGKPDVDIQPFQMDRFR